MAPQNKSFHWQMERLPLGPAIKLRRGELWAKHTDKSVVLLGTYWGTHWELYGNRKPKKNPSARDPRENKLGPCLSMLSLLLGCIKFLFLKLFVTIFHLGYWKAWGVPCTGVCKLALSLLPVQIANQQHLSQGWGLPGIAPYGDPWPRKRYWVQRPGAVQVKLLMALSANELDLVVA